MNYLAVASNCNDAALASVLAIIKNGLSLIQLIGPILAIVSLIYHLTMMVKNPDDKKGLSKIKNSINALVVLFFVPIIVNAVFGLLDDSFEISRCWNSANYNTAREVTYIPIGEEKKNVFFTNPSDYEKGEKKPSTSESNNGGESNNSGVGNNPSTSSNGSLVKEESTDTLKVSIYKNGQYYITKIWVKNAYQQLNKFDSPNYGSTLYRPANLLSQAINQNGLSGKLVVGFNASGFYLRDTYDSASVNAYSAYDKTSVGSLVITNGKVVRNAYQHAVKTWYIMGVDQSNRMRIFEDVKSSDASSKKAWSESIIGTVRNTYTFASPLVVNGTASDIMTSMPSPGSALNRQAICQVDRNNFILITGGGLTRQNLIDIMLENHCITGTNFDGGGSIALLYKGANSQNIETILGGGRSLTEVGYFVG